MSFRRIPFQFTTTDPAERQRELEKRFGIPSRNKMHGYEHPLAMSSDYRDACSSPRLQHRVPIFVEGYDQPIRSSVDSANSVSENKKSNVRVIPIEIEGAETYPSTRHRTFSGPAGLAKESNEDISPQRDDASPLKRSMQDLSKSSKMKASPGPKVYNIPIKVEGVSTDKKKPKPEKVKSPVKKDHSRVNGYNMSSQVQGVEQKVEPQISEEQKIEMNITESLKKIENILEELKSYESGVQEFSGTGKDKQYRYLDEMLTRCMLRLDDIDTVGNDKVRSARKNAVKEVQACIDELERKVNDVQGESNSHVMLTEDLNHEINEVIECEDATEVSECEAENKILQPETVAKVLELADKTEFSGRTESNDVEMVDVASAQCRDEPVEIAIGIKSIQTCKESETKSSEKREYGGLDERNINDISKEISMNKVPKYEKVGKVSVLEPETEVSENAFETEDCERSDVNNVEMVKNPDEVHEGTPVESTSVNSPVTTEDDLVCNVNRIKAVEKLPSEINEGPGELSEIEMTEASPAQYITSELEHGINSSENLKEGKISQDSDVEMKEIENTLNEIKEKTVSCGSVELKNIPVEDTAVYTVVGSEVSPAGECMPQSNCLINSASSQNVEDIKTNAHGD